MYHSSKLKWIECFKFIMGREAPQQSFTNIHIVCGNLLKDALRAPTFGLSLYVTIVTHVAWLKSLQLGLAFIMHVPVRTLLMACGVQGAKSSSVSLLTCCPLESNLQWYYIEMTNKRNCIVWSPHTPGYDNDNAFWRGVASSKRLQFSNPF